MFAALRTGWAFGPVYVKSLGCLTVPGFQVVNQGSGDSDKNDTTRPPPVLFTCPPAPPTVIEQSASSATATMIPKDILIASSTPSMSVQTRSQLPQVTGEVTPVTRGLYYTLTSINGVLDLSSPMSCPAEPHPTLGKSVAEATTCSDQVPTTTTATVTELVIPPAEFSTTAAIPITVENSYVLPQTEALPVFEIQKGNIVMSSPSASCYTSSLSSSMMFGSPSSSADTIPASPILQVVPTDLSGTSDPTESHQVTSPIPSLASSMISEALEDEDLPPNLAQAVRTVTETGSLTPLIKEELKYTIQNKRLLKGESELVLEPHKESASKLSPEEKEKREKRRERNKLAAQKCRGKRRMKMESLEEETHRLENLNASLRKQMKTLHLEKDKLRLLLQCHDTSLDMCPANKKLSTSEEDTFVPTLVSEPSRRSWSASSAATNEVFVESSDTDTCSDDIISLEGQEGEDMEAMNMMVVDGEVVIE